jgi:hypothetical protein
MVVIGDPTAGRSPVESASDLRPPLFGAQFGYGLAWTLVLSYPLMAAIQEISARIGQVTGMLALPGSAAYALGETLS